MATITRKGFRRTGEAVPDDRTNAKAEGSNSLDLGNGEIGRDRIEQKADSDGEGARVFRVGNKTFSTAFEAVRYAAQLYR